MTASSLIIVADRGSVRAYRVEETPTRGPSLKLVQAFDIPDVMRATTMRHRTPMTDWPRLEAEMDRRICKEVATEIAKIVVRNPGKGWSFAAPESIYAKIVEHLPPKIRKLIVEHVESDLVKLPAAALRPHFRSLQPVQMVSNQTARRRSVFTD
jgi:protein required for attachment to host cells